MSFILLLKVYIHQYKFSTSTASLDFQKIWQKGQSSFPKPEHEQTWVILQQNNQTFTSHLSACMQGWFVVSYRLNHLTTCDFKKTTSMSTHK